MIHELDRMELWSPEVIGIDLKILLFQVKAVVLLMD